MKSITPRDVLNYLIGIAILLSLGFIFGLFEEVSKFFMKIFFVKENLSLPIPKELCYFIDALIHVITYKVVNIIFKLFNLWDRNLMKIAYVVISELIALGFVYLMRIFIDYWWAFLIIPSFIFMILIIILIRYFISVHKKTEEEESNGSI